MLIAFWRTLFLYLLVIISLRFMGKRQIGELQPSELVTTIMISNIAAIPIENMGTPLISGIIPIVTLACLEVLSSALAMKSKRARGIIMGNPRAIIRDGKIDQKEMEILRWSIDDLTEQLRGTGTFNIDEVLYAIVETNGKLSVYPKFSQRPLSNKDANIPPPKCEAPSAVVISDGEVIQTALDFCHLDVKWLNKVLKKEGLKPEDIFLMSGNNAAEYCIVKMEAKK